MAIDTHLTLKTQTPRLDSAASDPEANLLSRLRNSNRALENLLHALEAAEPEERDPAVAERSFEAAV